ncbi:MAG: Multiple antibiotic transporter [Candidatus Methanohalarchaeum thermophilum]|uniref:UPF0056 membrane protein n=1 Tax=Methanohalarchaeum thermophilum TaxID=1903181 RepID=A0A1Q6DV79_METT1|nr:MAG: Multiple antibiotic transporter [Candidatus Methanohalarchaeum thermophilum]
MFVLDYLSYLLTSFTTIFVIVDPLGNLPMFIALTEPFSSSEREKVSRRSTVLALVILLLITLTGGFILDFFKVTIEGLKIAGGILLFAISIDILMGGNRRESYVEKGVENRNVDSLAAFPIALPLYTGPGAITASIVLYSSAESILLKVMVLVSIVVTYAIVRVTQRYSNYLIRVLGKSGSDIVARVMAIFLAAIGIEYFFSGLFAKIQSFI